MGRLSPPSPLLRLRLIHDTVLRPFLEAYLSWTAVTPQLLEGEEMSKRGVTGVTGVTSSREKKRQPCGKGTPMGYRGDAQVRRCGPASSPPSATGRLAS